MSGSTAKNAGGQKPLRVDVKRLAHAADLPLPTYQSAGAAGLDLVAAIEAGETIEIAPGSRQLVPTGLVIALPQGYEAQIRPRSGLALKHGITVLNSPGTIDADYRGEIGVILVNLGTASFVIERGHRIAQMVIAPVVQVELTNVSDVGETERGSGGFGSTGG